MEIIVKENRELIIKNAANTQNENDIETIYLTVPEKYEDFNKKIAFVTEEGVKWGLVENNTYTIERSITKFENVLIYVWLTKDDQDFRSVEEALTFNKNHKIDEEVTPEEQSDIERVISILEGEITKVDNLDIDAVKVGDTATITITDKNGISKSVEIKDGQVTQEQIEEIIRIVQETIDIPENLSDLNDDSTHRTVTDNEKSTWNNKQEALVSGANIKTINNQSILGEGNINIEGGSGTTDYSDLENKPKINNVELNGNKSLQDLGIQPRGNYALTEDIPTKTSDLQNDSGFITGYTETDPTVPSHVKNISQADISNWNNKSDFSGDYNDLDNKPTIPSEVTETTVSNWGFTKNIGTITGITMNGVSKGTSGVVDLGTVITSHQDISGKADKISVVQTSTSTIEINPNTFYKFGEVASLNITLASITDNTIYNEYMFEFVSGTTATTLTLPSSIKWLQTPTIDANKIYQCSIVDNVGLLVGVTNV